MKKNNISQNNYSNASIFAKQDALSALETSDCLDDLVDHNYNKILKMLLGDDNIQLFEGCIDYLHKNDDITSIEKELLSYSSVQLRAKEKNIIKQLFEQVIKFGVAKKHNSKEGMDVFQHEILLSLGNICLINMILDNLIAQN